MSARFDYIQSLKREEREVLIKYHSFLLVFYKSLEKITHKSLIDYTIMEQQLMNRLVSINKVKNAFDCYDQCHETQESAEKCRHLLNKIRHSLDRKKAELHDEISSLNEKNSAMGLRYNRYNTQVAKPGLIDINL